MIYLPYIFLIISGLSAGFLTAAAFVAFIAMLGIFPKVAAKTKTGRQCVLYENCLILGILLSTFLQFFTSYTSMNYTQGTLPPVWCGILILITIGLFGGIYIGFLIGGLSEILNVFPIYARKAHIKRYISAVIYFLAFGKSIFILIQFFLFDV